MTAALVARKGDGHKLREQLGELDVARATTDVASADVGLDLHEEVSDPKVLRCSRWPRGMVLVSNHGEAVEGRCHAANLCAYCARQAAIENSELLALDALHGPAPTVWLVLTTRSADRSPRTFYESRRQLMKALKRRFPDLQYAALLEFTTGYGARSGGKRRQHWNVLLKGVSPGDVVAIRTIVEKVWCPRTDSEPEAQFVGDISDAGGLMRYIALHFQKASQAPPAGWKGIRFLKSRGYLWTDTPAAREAARESLRDKRELWRAAREHCDANEAEARVAIARNLRAETSWQLVRLPERAAGLFDDRHLDEDTRDAISARADCIVEALDNIASWAEIENARDADQEVAVAEAWAARAALARDPDACVSAAG